MSDPGESPVDLAAVRERILTAHYETVEGVLAAADAVAEGWDGRSVADRSAVVGPLRRELDRRGLNPRLLALLADAVDAAGRELQADPVPAPPYLAVTSRGPVCRATLSDGRLVVAVAAFRVERSGRGTDEGGPDGGGTDEGGPDGGGRGARYVLAGGDPAGSLNVRFKSGDRRKGVQ